MNPSLYSTQPEQLFEAVAKGPWERIGIIAHVPTEYVSEPLAEKLIDQLRADIGDRIASLLHFDSNFEGAIWHGLPCMQAWAAEPQMFDAVMLLSPSFSEILFYFFDRTPLRQLPVVAPFLAAQPHRLFLRRRVFEFLEHQPFARVLEVGAIEHMDGGHRTTQALAEALGDNGTIVTIDRNPLSLELSRYYCRGLHTPITTLCGDVWDLVSKPPAALTEAPFDVLLIHHGSDNDGDETMVKLFEQMRPLLSPNGWMLFQSLHDRRPRADSLQAHLVENGYKLGIMPITNAVKVKRFFVIARPRRANRKSRETAPNHRRSMRRIVERLLHQAFRSRHATRTSEA